MGIGMDRLIMYLTNNASIQCCCSLKWDQRKKTSLELEDDENGLFLYCKLMRMEFDYWK
jgi:hypothetical protein